MPLVKLYLPQQVTNERARGLADAVHHALTRTCAVPLKDRFQLMFRLAPAEMDLDPCFPGVERGPEATVVEIAFLHGRTAAQKRNLYAEVAQGAVAVGWRADDVMIMLLENDPLDWSLGRGLTYAEAKARTE
jgi:phenylpyruvate tautomerase PptA (4-oxalocrotonate tautomerase family)